MHTFYTHVNGDKDTGIARNNYLHFCIWYSLSLDAPSFFCSSKSFEHPACPSDISFQTKPPQFRKHLSKRHGVLWKDAFHSDAISQGSAKMGFWSARSWLCTAPKGRKDSFGNILVSHLETWLAGGFKQFLLSSLFGEDEPNLTHIFEMGWNH